MLINKYYLSPKSDNGRVFDARDMVIKIIKMEREVIDFHVNYKLQ